MLDIQEVGHYEVACQVNLWREARYAQNYLVVKIDKNDFKVSQIQPVWGEQVLEKPKSNAASVW